MPKDKISTKWRTVIGIGIFLFTTLLFVCLLSGGLLSIDFSLGK